MIEGKVLSIGRVYGVIDLLKRLICLLPAGTPIGDRITVVAQVPYLGAAMNSFRVVSERTVQRWSRDAQSLTLIEVDVRAWKFGNRNWNEWTIAFDRLREVTRHDPTRPDTMSGPRPDTMSGPQIRELNSGEENQSRAGPEPARPGIDFLPDWEELRPFADERIAALTDEEMLLVHGPVRSRLAGARAYEPLTEQWLRDEQIMRGWHAWQLRLSDQAVGSTRAHQLLVVAAARHAVAFPRERLLRNRVALFVGLVSKRNWEPARCRLEGVLAEMLVAR